MKTLFTKVSVPTETAIRHLRKSLHVKHQTPPVQSFGAKYVLLLPVQRITASYQRINMS